MIGELTVFRGPIGGSGRLETSGLAPLGAFVLLAMTFRSGAFPTADLVDKFVFGVDGRADSVDASIADVDSGRGLVTSLGTEETGELDELVGVAASSGLTVGS